MVQSEQVEHKRKRELVTYLDHLVKVVTVYMLMAALVVLEAAAGMEAAVLALTVEAMMTVPELEVQDLFGLKVIKQ